MRKAASLSSLSRHPGAIVPGVCVFLLFLLSLVGCGTGSEPGVSVAPTATSTVHGISLHLAPQPLVTATATVTFSPTVVVTPGNALITPPGVPLPGEAQCAASIHRAPFEPRPQNFPANHNIPTAQQIANLTPWGSALGQSIQADTLRKQMTGNFTGTTDEILQWAACKWGVNPDLVRAEAVIESSWKQDQAGDSTNDMTLCPPGVWNGQSCNQSYGILQIKYYYFQSTWPMSRDDTAFNAEYVYGMLRACYEGWTTYLKDRTPLPGYPRYHAGDIWGCLGRWYSGNWYDQGAVDYISKVKATLAGKPWLNASF